MYSMIFHFLFSLKITCGCSFLSIDCIEFNLNIGEGGALDPSHPDCKNALNSFAIFRCNRMTCFFLICFFEILVYFFLN